MTNYGYGEIPMEGEFLSKPDNAPGVKAAENPLWTDKGQPLDKAPDGVGPDRNIPKALPSEPIMYDPFCNYLGYEGGNTHIIGWDEYKILANTVNSVPVECAEDCQTIDGQNGKERI